MELPVSFQAAQFGLSVLFALGLGLLYDWLRSVRRTVPALQDVCDGLFCLLLGAGLLLFALYVGRGQFRLFFFVGMLAGLILYFLLLSPLLLPVFCAAQRFLRALLAPARFLLKKIKKFFQRYWIFCKNRL